LHWKYWIGKLDINSSYFFRFDDLRDWESFEYMCILMITKYPQYHHHCRRPCLSRTNMATDHSVISLSQSPAAPVAHENDSDKDDDIEEMRFCKIIQPFLYEGLIRIQSTSDFINLISLSRGNDSFPTQLYENDDDLSRKSNPAAREQLFNRVPNLTHSNDIMTDVGQCWQIFGQWYNQVSSIRNY